MELRVTGMPTEEVLALRAGAPDANGQPAQRWRGQGMPDPCRHCLGMIAEGESKLLLAYRPFPTLQPYAESGPIFLHGDACPRYDHAELPGWFDYLEPAAVRGYDANDWILYQTGDVVPGRQLREACASILASPEVAYVHVRSRFGCFQCRVDRA